MIKSINPKKEQDMDICGIFLIGINVILCLFMVGIILWLITSLILDKRREKRYTRNHVIYNQDTRKEVNE